ncbi:hypothetical protein MUU54_07680 [Rhizobium tarimense]|nr:hypothetical protein [Pseudorhizobium tarimense]
MFGRDPWATVVALVAGTSCMTLISSMSACLSYGLLAVTMLILAPGSEPYEGALLKAVEIGVGCLSGVAVTALLFPRRAHREADHHLAKVARSCAPILEESLKSIETQELKDLQSAHDHVEQQLQLARASSLQSRPHLRSPSNVHRLRDELRRKLERLWYTLALVDRLRDAFASSPPPPEVKQASEAARRAMTERLNRIADLLEGQQVKKKNLAERDRVEPGVSGRRNDSGSFLFSFACGEIEAAIDDVVETGPGSSTTDDRSVSLAKMTKSPPARQSLKWKSRLGKAAL